MTNPSDGSPPVGAPLEAAAARSQDDRALAACAHLSFLAGFWLVAPIAIYVVKRKESRFVAFYAAQAVVLQLLFGVATGFGVAVCIALLAVAGISRQPAVAALAAAVPLIGILVGCLGLLCVHAYAAFCAWQGKEITLPIAGSIARAILNADQGAAKT